MKQNKIKTGWPLFFTIWKALLLVHVFALPILWIWGPADVSVFESVIFLEQNLWLDFLYLIGFDVGLRFNALWCVGMFLNSIIYWLTFSMARKTDTGGPNMQRDLVLWVFNSMFFTIFLGFMCTHYTDFPQELGGNIHEIYIITLFVFHMSMAASRFLYFRQEEDKDNHFGLPMTKDKLKNTDDTDEKM